MTDEQLRQLMRERLLSAFSDYSTGTGGVYDGTGVINTKGYKKTANDIKISETRARSGSKENCSPDVFDHLQLMRRVDQLPILFRYWVMYRYAPKYDDHLNAELVEVTLGELKLLSGRRSVVKNLEKLTSTILVNRRNFPECLQKELSEAVGVHRSVYARVYKKPAEDIKGYFNELDSLALDALLLHDNGIARA